MLYTSESVETLVEQFSKLPTVGRKTARRLAAFVLKMPREEVQEIADALIAVKDRVIFCSVCFNVTDHDPCPICASPKRDRSVVCVVEEPNDVMALERTEGYNGLYHVLGGAISPLDGIGPEDLRIRELVARLSGRPAGESDGQGLNGGDARTASAPESAPESAPDTAPESAHRTEPTDEDHTTITEVILAVNPNVEGDTTAYYISRLLDPFDVRISRLAQGMPLGGDLEFTDEATLTRALEGRVSV